MFPIRLGLASRSGTIGTDDLIPVAAAINLQVARDFGPIWGVTATVQALPNSAQVPLGVWPVFVVDDVDGRDLGVHLNDHGQPFALVKAGPNWSLTASHECLEMLADPTGNKTQSAASIVETGSDFRDGDEKFLYVVEVCDPSQDGAFAYLIDDTLVADFYTPRYFDPVAASGVRYSFSGHITRPRQVLPKGYLSWVNPVTQTLQQATFFGEAKIIDRGPVPAGSGLPLRAFIDRGMASHTPYWELPSDSALLAKRADRSGFLARAARVGAAGYEASLAEPAHSSNGAVPAAVVAHATRSNGHAPGAGASST